MLKSIQNSSIHLNQNYEWVKKVKQGIHIKILNLPKLITQTSLTVRAKYVETAEEIKSFFLRNNKIILFIGCNVLTAYFIPHLFFPIAVATIILRVELSFYLKELANHHLKDECNPYKTSPQYGSDYITPVELTMAVIASIDALALGTIFVAGSWSAAFIPILGGIAAGSCTAKLGMDIAQTFV